MRAYINKSTFCTSTFPTKLRELVYGPGTGQNLYDYIINNSNPPLTLSQKKVAYDKLSELFKTHKINITSKIQCPCNKSSTINKQTLFDHINIAHVKYVLFSCSKCSSIFFSENSFNKHDKDIHTNKRALQDSQQDNRDQFAKKPKLESAPLKNPTIVFPVPAAVLQQLSQAQFIQPT